MLIGVASVACTPVVTHAAGGITCDGATAMLAPSPAITTEARPTALRLQQSPSSSCIDGSGHGLSGARIRRLEIDFPSLSCLGSAGRVGQGSGEIEWSDGTRSDASFVAGLETAVSGSFEVAVTTGHFAGARSTTWFSAMPAQGDCTRGVTAEAVTIGALTLRAG
jgi:hypothetical protein